MQQPAILMFTARKGGVGTSTCCTNFAIAAAKQGKRVLLLDLDFENRSLDLLLGLEDSIIYDVCDLFDQKIDAEKVLLSVPHLPTLWFCASPYQAKPLPDVATVRKRLTKLAKEYAFDYLLLDVPAAHSPAVFALAASIATEVCIVSTDSPASLRAAERVNLTLRDLGVSRKRMLLNAFPLWDVTTSVKNTLLAAMETAKLPLCGVIPYDPAFLTLAGGEGIDTAGRRDTRTAYSNLVTRFGGEEIPLFTHFKDVSRRILLK